MASREAGFSVRQVTDKHAYVHHRRGNPAGTGETLVIRPAVTGVTDVISPPGWAQLFAGDTTSVDVEADNKGYPGIPVATDTEMDDRQIAARIGRRSSWVISIVAIMTDGMENASSGWRRSDIKALVEHLAGSTPRLERVSVLTIRSRNQ